MNSLQTHRNLEEYFTAWFIGCIMFITGITIAPVYLLTIVPRIASMEMISTVTSPVLSVPYYLQLSFSLLLALGLCAIIGICLWRKATFTLLVLGCIPMVVALLFYTIPQVMDDLYQQVITSWKVNAVAYQILPLVSVIFLFTIFVFFILSIIALLGRLWLNRYVAS